MNFNDNTDSFEQELKAHAVREIPAEWRDVILKMAAAKSSWPGPNAWRALAACWVIIAGLHLLSPSSLPKQQFSQALWETQQANYEFALAMIRPRHEQR
ncbi:MAG: hypothetical protein ACI9DF_003630 [Verrucomicrobiales bacterium]|jgi:hypothetical protein